MILNLLKKHKVRNDDHRTKLRYKLISKLNEIAPLYIQVSEKSKYPTITVEPFDDIDVFVVRATNNSMGLTAFIVYDANVFENIRSFCRDWNTMVDKAVCHET